MAFAVLVRRHDADPVAAVVHGGFLSVADNRVGILAEEADLAQDIDVAAAEQDLQQAQGSDDEEAVHQQRRAEARIRAHGMVH